MCHWTLDAGVERAAKCGSVGITMWVVDQWGSDRVLTFYETMCHRNPMSWNVTGACFNSWLVKLMLWGVSNRAYLIDSRKWMSGRGGAERGRWRWMEEGELWVLVGFRVKSGCLALMFGSRHCTCEISSKVRIWSPACQIIWGIEPYIALYIYWLNTKTSMDFGFDWQKYTNLYDTFPCPN
jgi:hypothetical protein